MKNYYIDDNSVFTSRKLESGEPIGVAFIVSESEIKPHNFGEYLTHSDTPNCKVKRAGNFVRVDSIKNLREGTELTIDFNQLGMGQKVKYKEDFGSIGYVEEAAATSLLNSVLKDENFEGEKPWFFKVEPGRKFKDVRKEWFDEEGKEYDSWDIYGMDNSMGHLYILKQSGKYVVADNERGIVEIPSEHNKKFDSLQLRTKSAVKEGAVVSETEIIKIADKLLKSLPKNIFELEKDKYTDYNENKKEFKDGKSDKLVFARYESNKSVVTDKEAEDILNKSLKTIQNSLPEGVVVDSQGDEFRGVLSLSVATAVSESAVGEDSISGDEEEFDSSITNGLYTTDEIFEKSKRLPVHALLDDEQYRAWFEYYQRRNMKLESYNAEMEAYWYKTVTEALASGDEDVVIAHGWEPTLPLNSSNLLSASIRLENAINNVEIKEYDYCGKDFTSVLEAAEEKNLVPVYIMLTASPTPMGSAIRKVTKSKVSHSALAFDPSLESMISFNMAGLVRESRSKYIRQYGEDMSVAVYVVFITPEQKSMMQSTCTDMIKNADKWKYNLKGLFGTLLNKPIGKGNVMFCSEFVDRVFKASGIRLTDKRYSGTVTPDDIYNSKCKNIFKIFDGDIGDYKEDTATAKALQYRQQSDVPILHKKVDIVADDDVKRTSREKEDLVKEYFVEAIDEGYLSPLFSPNYILTQMVNK